MKKILFSTFSTLCFLTQTKAQTSTIFGFEEMNDSLGARGVWNGSNGVITYDFSESTMNLTIHSNWDTSFGGYWAGGWALSNKNYTTEETSDFTKHLYASKPGGGSETNGEVYAVGTSNSYLLNPENGRQAIVGCNITNSTYAYNSMLLGDNFARKFTSENKDSFVLLIDFYQNNEQVNRQREYLANFSDPDKSKHFILKDWKQITFDYLDADSIVFSFESSDVGDFGINTPQYFCIDEVQMALGLDARGLSAAPVTVYPNPFSDVINVNSNASITTLEVFDATGRLVAHQEGVNSMNTAHLPRGYYVLHVQTSLGQLHKKHLIKQ